MDQVTMEEAVMRRWVHVIGASVALAGGLAVIPVTASSASNAAAGAGDDAIFALSAAQLPVLVIWLAVGLAGMLAAIVSLSLARRRARIAVSAVLAEHRVSAEHRVANAAVPAA